MGVIYLLTYIFGSIFLTLASRKVILDIRDAEPIGGSLLGIAVGSGFILMAALLHTVSIKRRGDAGILENTRKLPIYWLFIAIAAWILPTIAAWIQFEMFYEDILMAPFTTIIGAIGIVLWLTSHATSTWTVRAPVITAAIALIGLPIGLFTFGYSLNHFNEHLSNVTTYTISMSSTGANNTLVTKHVFKAHDASFISENEYDIGEETRSMIGALANAEPVDVDIEEEIEAGRMKYLDDGRLVFRNDDGTWPTKSGVETFMEDFDSAIAAGITQNAENKSIERENWEKELEVRRRSGRIFTSPPTLEDK